MLLPAGPLKTHRLLSCSLHVNVWNNLANVKGAGFCIVVMLSHMGKYISYIIYIYIHVISEKQLPWVSETPICFRSSCPYATRDFVNAIGPCTQLLCSVGFGSDYLLANHPPAIRPSSEIHWFPILQKCFLVNSMKVSFPHNMSNAFFHANFTVLFSIVFFEKTLCR